MSSRLKEIKSMIDKLEIKTEKLHGDIISLNNQIRYLESESKEKYKYEYGFGMVILKCTKQANCISCFISKKDLKEHWRLPNCKSENNDE